MSDPKESDGSSEEPTTGPNGSHGVGDRVNLEGDLEVVDVNTQSYPTDSLFIFDFAQEPFETDLFADNGTLCRLSIRTQTYDGIGFANLPTPHPSTPSFSTPLQVPFAADSALLGVPILDVLRTFASIATAFDVATSVWDLTYLHILPPSIPGAATALPANLHPIPAQYNIPHHPLLDLLPWPGVREKLICMLAMPSKLRPPVAQEDSGDEHDQAPIKQTKAIMHLIQDLDENEDGLGIRVHGNSTTWAQGNELVEDAWEIGDLFYRKWWWCLDRKIVETSNLRRRERGLPKLRWVA